MPRLLIVAVMVGLGLGLGLVGRAGFSAWLEWIDEPLRQPPNLPLVRPPVTGPQVRPTAPRPTSVPPTLAAATAVPQRTPTPLAAPTLAPPRPASNAPTSAPTAGGTPIPLGGQQRRIANTDGLGVALRDAPGGARQPAHGYDEGQVVTVVEQQGAWTRVQGHDGREGWVLSVTLAP